MSKENCPTCGAECKIVGNGTTHHYEPPDWLLPYDEIESQLEESQDRVKEWEATAKGWMLSCEKAQARVKELEAALEFAKMKCEDIEGDPAFGESQKKIRQQDIEWAGQVVKCARAALKDGDK